MTPAEQIARFVERHPGEWHPYERTDAFLYPPEERLGGYVIIVNHVRASLFVDADGVLQITTSLSWRGEYAPHLGISGREAPPLVSRIAIRVADSMQIFGGDVDALPPWLADPVRRQLRTRAGELLTLAGSSPADVVSAAETLDEALCGRPGVEVTGVLRALMSMGMSCRWATGADEAADDYVGFVSRRLDVVAAERDALAAKLAQVQAMQAAQEEYVTARMIAARSVLRGVADEPRASQVTALDAADAYLVDALYRKPKTTETP